MQQMSETRIIGTGDIKVIVVHDWFVDTDSWGSFFDFVDRSRFSYALFEARGYGSRRDEEGTFSVEEAAKDVLAFADRLGWNQFAVVGHSMGAKIAQRVLPLAPGRVTRLVGVAGVPAAPFPVSEPLGRLFAAAPGSAEARRAIVDHVTGNAVSATWLDYFADRSMRTSRPEAFAAYGKSWVETDFAREVAGNPVPVKIIVGERDKGISPAVASATWLKFYPNATLDVIPAAGHYPMHEAPLTLISSVESFLQEG
jgi:pimeloyl-ACP methyl ester carboxylesterase